MVGWSGCLKIEGVVEPPEERFRRAFSFFEMKQGSFKASGSFFRLGVNPSLTVVMT
jgi:hypothetical protein